MAAEVRDWDISDVGLDPQPWQVYPRQTQFAVAAALKAARNACFTTSDVDPLRLGVFLGCGEVFPDFIPFAEATSKAFRDDRFEMNRFLKEYSREASPEGDMLFEPGIAVSQIAGLLNAQGPYMNITNACVSSSSAIGEALQVIRRGDADVIMAGGAHSMIHPMGITGFHRLSTLSTRNEDPQRASRPFDRDRDGFVVGEGAAIVVLEELDHARQRGAEILAELKGYGATHDAFRITDPRPDARGAARCMQIALEDAQLAPEDIDYINARFKHEEHDGTLDDCIRRDRVHVLCAGDSERRGSSHNQL
jgi:3-oxoacyl-[acyl-carrier-protein] synthase II